MTKNLFGVDLQEHRIFLLVWSRACSCTLRVMLQAGDWGASGGGASPARGGGGGDVARGLEGQVKALRSRVEELLERAREAEVFVCDA